MKNTFSKLVSMTKRHSPEILMIVGISGMVATTVMAVKATPKATTLMAQKREECEVSVTVKETAKVIAVCYGPAILTGLFSVGCLIGSTNMSMRRNAAMAAAYSLSETALREYRNKVIDVIGDEKDKEIHREIVKEHITNQPTREVIQTQQGSTLCYDWASSRYFNGDVDKIRKSLVMLNRQMLDDGYVTLNDLYYEIGLENIGVGDSLGWSRERGYVDLELSSHLTQNATPCVVIGYTIPPEYLD